MRFPISLLAVVAMAASASLSLAATAPAPAVPAKPPGSVAILLGVDSVRKELHLTSLQRAVLDDIRTNYRDDAREIVAKTKEDLESKKQAQVSLDSLTASSDRHALGVLNDDQRKRLTEIQFQILGGYQLLSPAVQKKLALTDAQKAKIATIWTKGQAYVTKVNAQFEKGQISLHQRLLNLRADRLKRSDEFIAALTPKQHSQFLYLEGEEFEFAS